MNADVKNMLSRVARWPEEDQDELAQVALEIEARRHGLYHATPEELEAIDEALAAVSRGEVASDEEVETIFAKYRRALGFASPPPRSRGAMAYFSTAHPSNP